MRLVVDTNVLISALLSERAAPARLIALWRAGGFDLLMSREQLDELVRVTRYQKIRARLSPPLAGRLINQLRDLGVMVTPLPPVQVSPDPNDDFLLATALAGRADFLVTGDRRDVLALGRFEGTRIVSVSAFLELFGR